MSERMEEEMVAPTDGSKEAEEAKKKPMEDDMGDSTEKQMGTPMKGDTDMP